MVQIISEMLSTASSMLNRDVRVRCPLCNAKSQVIYCVECLNSGTFCHSQYESDGERYMDICVNVFRIRGKMKLLEQKILELDQEKQRASLLMIQIEKQKKKNENMQNTAIELKRNNDLLHKKSQRTDSMIEHRHRINLRYRSSMAPAKEMLASTKKKASMHYKELQDISGRLKVHSCALIDDLLRFVFPLEYLGERHSGEGAGPLQLMMQAPEGSLWSIDDAYSFSLYSISKLLIPGSGSLLNFIPSDVHTSDEVVEATCPDWAVGRDQMPCRVLSITAALTHVTLLVNIIACLMQVVLPHHLSHAEFNDHDLTEEVLNFLLTKLSINVVVLATAVGVAPDSLSSLHCIVKNLVLVIKHLSHAKISPAVHLSEAAYRELHRGSGALTLRSYTRCKNFLPYLNSALHENTEQLLYDYHVVSSLDLDLAAT
ncbi:beclin 1-associated autophagy-related key regulator-like [Hyalella azteca]|uniref:Beclin 1-associated autophagy-related key regulator-like n=1 Tax=Hyalella azteca TaxID=294128 RepID=A0A8B7NIT9_HYAAZ|nr:beclin 1-associated autophagy-related key regulator-like [Hyalella azteca]